MSHTSGTSVATSDNGTSGSSSTSGKKITQTSATLKDKTRQVKKTSARTESHSATIAVAQKTSTPTRTLSKVSLEETLSPLSPIPQSRIDKIRKLRDPIKSTRDSIQSAVERSKENEQILSLEEQVVELQEKYSHLQGEYDSLKTLYHGAMSSTQPESLQKQRVFVLKSQNIQLSRHVNALKEDLESRDSFVYEAEEDLYKIRDVLKGCLKSNTPADKSKSSSLSEQLKICLSYIEALQKQMHRKIKDHLQEERDKTPDFEFMTEFISRPKKSDAGKASLGDICSGKTEHLNLKHVSRLESQLAGLLESMPFLMFLCCCLFLENY